MGFLGRNDQNDLVFQPNARDLEIGIPSTLVTNNLTILSGAILPAFDNLFVKPTGESQLGTVTSGIWNGATIAQGYGGTGQSSYNTGDILYVNAGGNMTVLPSGSEGQSLKIVSGALAWG